MIFVTAMYNIRSDDYWSEMMGQFERLMEVITVPIFLWTDRPTAFDATKHRSPHLHILVAPLTAFVTWSDCLVRRNSLQLPQHRSPTKDTLEYMALMNCKVEMMWRTVPFLSSAVNASHLVWIDAGIMKIFKAPNIAEHFQRFQTLTGVNASKITIPGCWPETQKAPQRDSICWRFCGGIVIVPLVAIDMFYERVRTGLAALFEARKMVWEVNLWAEIEARHPEAFVWYSADHNERILDYDA